MAKGKGGGKSGGEQTGKQVASFASKGLRGEKLTPSQQKSVYASALNQAPDRKKPK